MKEKVSNIKSWGWVISCSIEYMDYCLIAATSLRQNGGLCGELPIITVLLDEIDSKQTSQLNDLDCKILEWEQINLSIAESIGIETSNPTSPRIRAGFVKATVPLWSPFYTTCLLDADILVLADLDQLWHYHRPGRLVMAIEASQPYSTYVKDQQWLSKNWGINYDNVINTGLPLYNSGVILSDRYCRSISMEWTRLLCHLLTPGWDKAVVSDDQLWLSIALSRSLENHPIELPETFNALYLRHLRKESTFDIKSEMIESHCGDQIHVLHLVGMKRYLEQGMKSPLADYVRRKVKTLLGADAPFWASW